MKAIHKEYIRGFVLEETKLTRLVEVVHGCLGSPSSVPNDHFEVFVRRNRVEEATTLDEVFETANTRENPVYRLLFTSSASASSPGHGDNEIQVDFDGAARETSANPSGPALKVAVSIRSDAPGWAARTLSAVEEQVDRTRFDDLGIRGALVIVLLLLVILLAGLLASALPFRLSVERPPERTMWLSKADIHQLAKSLETNKTLSEEQVRGIITMQLRNVLSDFGEPTSNQIPPSPTRKGSAWLGALLLFGPVVVVIATALLLARCYPSALFLWGDAIGRYENLKQTRNILWPIIIGTTIVGLLTNAFRAGLISYFAQS